MRIKNKNHKISILRLFKKYKKISSADLRCLYAGYSWKLIKEINERSIMDNLLHNYLESGEEADYKWFNSDAPNILKRLMDKGYICCYKYDDKGIFYEYKGVKKK